jgi:hypothetical protein
LPLLGKEKKIRREEKRREKEGRGERSKEKRGEKRREEKRREEKRREEENSRGASGQERSERLTVYPSHSLLLFSSHSGSSSANASALQTKLTVAEEQLRKLYTYLAGAGGVILVLLLMMIYF